ncbi:uncharacterized protein ARB_03870 [Trichophyton benhamiae CBS 112371]|uniref:Uncharacterized protein n=1 Tax=Arthroderma benhamiae (strain ATCC MYA-4681 / CBS 112371) TaxID=663331 RepID=D4B5W3_ARTBC|nr:uncharacterized protein ARB_03870 [Trichophyton benhamiae CBS 112371]EFE29299.1 hypothetical protein ARB_03870 [Trichophyton benhamiae CBS 112371]
MLQIKNYPNENPVPVILRNIAIFFIFYFFFLFAFLHNQRKQKLKAEEAEAYIEAGKKAKKRIAEGELSRCDIQQFMFMFIRLATDSVTPEDLSWLGPTSDQRLRPAYENQPAGKASSPAWLPSPPIPDLKLPARRRQKAQPPLHCPASGLAIEADQPHRRRA